MSKYFNIFFTVMLLSGCITANALNKGNNYFNDDNCIKITYGMSKDEVINLIGKPTHILMMNTDNLINDDWDYIQSVTVYNPRLLVTFLNIDTETGELVNEGHLYQVSARVSFGKDGGVIQYSRQKSVDEVKYVPSNSQQSTQSNNT